MKKIRNGTLLAVFLIFITGFSYAVDIESIETYRLIDRLLRLPGPGAPEIFEDMVIFTASSSHRRVGIAFAHECFAIVHNFRPLFIRRDPRDISPRERNPSEFRDSGIVFHLHKIPEGVTELEYRLIIDGLWTTDPANPNTRWDSTSGLRWSIFAIPDREIIPHPLNGPPGSLSFSFRGPPGETVTVAGSFNGWDPFMYELREGPRGTYTITIPLPPGRYQYVFFHRGQRFLDPYNPNRVYARDGSTVSEIVIQ